MTGRKLQIVSCIIDTGQVKYIIYTFAYSLHTRGVHPWKGPVCFHCHVPRTLFSHEGGGLLLLFLNCIMTLLPLSNFFTFPRLATVRKLPGIDSMFSQGSIYVACSACHALYPQQHSVVANSRGKHVKYPDHPTQRPNVVIPHYTSVLMVTMCLVRCSHTTRWRIVLVVWWVVLVFQVVVLIQVLVVVWNISWMIHDVNSRIWVLHVEWWVRRGCVRYTKVGYYKGCVKRKSDYKCGTW